MFGEKLKKLRTDNQLTQEELAERLYVTRTAVSKWENNKGYPNIDSLKAISDLFGVSIDELIADTDIENHRLLEETQSKKCYWIAMAFLMVATAAALAMYFLHVPYFGFFSMIGVGGYIVFAVLSKPKYKRMSAKKLVVPYIVSRLVILAVMVVVIISIISAMGHM